MAKVTDKKISSDDKLVCLSCGSKAQNNFYVTQDKMRKAFGKIPYCKDCIKNVIYPKYLSKYKAQNLAIYYLCRKIDVPYIHTAYQGALETIKNPKSTMYGEDYIVQAYMQNIAFADKNGWGATFDDSQDEDKIDGIVSFAEITKVKRNKKDTRLDSNKYEEIEYDTDELIQKWGNYDVDDLAYLESEYLDWDDKLNGISDKTIEVIVKEICMQQYVIRRGREEGEDVNKEIATLQTLLKNGNLIEAQNKSAEGRQVGMVCEDIEFKRPIKTVDPELDDVDNMKTLLYGFIGSMSRTLGRENAFTKKFDELYDKYSVDIVKEIRDSLAEMNRNNVEEDDNNGK